MKKLIFITIAVCSSLLSIVPAQGMHENMDAGTMLKNQIKALVSLSCVDRYFNSVLRPNIIGSFYTHSNQKTKDEALQLIIDAVSFLNYQKRRVPIYILIYAGANPNTHRSYSSECVMLDAVLENDEKLVTLLFKQGANPKSSLYDHIKTMAIARLFIKNHVPISNLQYSLPNPLWHVITDDVYPAELLDLYIQHGANAACISKYEQICLLHWITEHAYYLQTNDNFLQKAAIILKAIPGMINLADRCRKTPLDYIETHTKQMQQFFKKSKSKGSGLQALQQLMVLFQDHGGVKSIPHPRVFMNELKRMELAQLPLPHELQLPLWYQKEKEMNENDDESCIIS